MERRGEGWVVFAAVVRGTAGVATGAWMIYALAAYGGRIEVA